MEDRRFSFADDCAEPSGSSLRLPPASLVITSRNRPVLLSETVESILEGSEVPDEIVIVDQSAHPHSELDGMQSERSCTVRYLFSETVGTSRGRNAGITAAKHDVLVFTDDDMFVTKDWYGKLVRALVRSGPDAVVTGRVLPTDAEQSGGFVPSIRVDEEPVTYRGRIGRDILYSNSMAMFRTAIDTVGDFDERLGGGARFAGAEDNDLAFRLLEAGYSILYVPEAVLYHRAWRSNSDYIPLCWSYGRGQGAFYGKYISLRDRYMLRRMGIDVRVLATRFAKTLFRDFRKASGELAYLFGLLSGVTEWLLIIRPARKQV